MTRPVILCIGSEKICGDSLGPEVGSRLAGMDLPAYVYGTVERPVNGVNIGEYLAMIKRRHKGALVLAVDAAIGESADIGRIRLSEEGVGAGAALGKELGKIGAVGLLGIVASGEDAMAALMAASYECVLGLSIKISQIIFDTVSFVLNN